MNDFKKATKLSITAKCSDLCTASVHDARGSQIGLEHDGYVPAFMPGDHYGDYVILDIDLATGTITNWKKPTPAQLKETFGDE